METYLPLAYEMALNLPNIRCDSRHEYYTKKRNLRLAENTASYIKTGIVTRVGY